MTLPVAALAMLLSLGAAYAPARRGFAFWAGAAPILAPYALRNIRTAVQPAAAASAPSIDHLHQRQAPKAVRLAQRLGGGYIKMGQVLSNRADTLPTAYVAAFSILQDRANPRPWAALERQLPAHLRSELRHVDQVPLGAASTGQVHAATLRDGRRVALKVQYREARGQFAADFGNVARLMRLTLPAMVPVVKTVRRRFAREFDYEREAENQAKLRRVLECSRRVRRRVAVPRPYPELGSRRVLVMELLEGEKLTARYERRMRALLGDERFERSRSEALGRAAPQQPPARLGPVRWASLPRVLWLRRSTRRHVRLLLEVAALQIFEGGLFNADPHPGNVIMMRGGRLGLLDYGQCVQLDPVQQARLAELTVLLAQGKGVHGSEALARAASAIGFRTRRSEHASLERLAKLFFDRDAGASPAHVIRMVNNCDPIVALPADELILASRVSLLLRGSSQLMGGERGLSVSRAWASHARRCCERQPVASQAALSVRQRRMSLGAF